jgi:hypothetical protein
MAAVLVVGWPWVAPVDASTTERLVVDRHSGLAIDGFDPLAYFVDGCPVLGSADHEYVYEGAVWRFANEGNRAAFIDRPDIYRPRFGGYDPTALLRGVAVPGNPTLWLIADGRLYLFADEAGRASFRGDAEGASREAALRWPDVERSLPQ